MHYVCITCALLRATLVERCSCATSMPSPDDARGLETLEIGGVWQQKHLHACACTLRRQAVRRTSLMHVFKEYSQGLRRARRPSFSPRGKSESERSNQVVSSRYRGSAIHGGVSRLSWSASARANALFCNSKKTSHAKLFEINMHLCSINLLK